MGQTSVDILPRNGRQSTASSWQCSRPPACKTDFLAESNDPGISAPEAKTMPYSTEKMHFAAYHKKMVRDRALEIYIFQYLAFLLFFGPQLPQKARVSAFRAGGGESQGSSGRDTMGRFTTWDFYTVAHCQINQWLSEE
ncbi:hypothetical protein AVEN_4635-1 [Araneus ventricosus]|uniref:Uncharacterized protein n=1 Tax=Araneus ventricosus TaxID=182803 RepID=A0A4Y2LMT2_ARAVE|nr:hypothetical protein AVEN_4635-1 [Araneus ventricosus]